MIHPKKAATDGASSYFFPLGALQWVADVGERMQIVPPGILPRLSPPVLPKEALAVPEGEDWIYEFLWSGVRVRAMKIDAGVWVLGRDGRNLSNRLAVGEDSRAPGQNAGATAEQ